MRTKALILGARPVPCRGPQIPLKGGVWRCDPDPAFIGKASIVTDNAIIPILSTETIELSGSMAQLVVKERIDLPYLGMEIHWIREE